MHRNPALFLMTLAVLVFASACEHAGPLEINEEDPLFEQIQTSIFDVNCALSGCHAGSSPQAGMNLTAGQSYDNIVDVASTERPDLRRIDPNNPDESYMLMKLRGDPEILGSRMPLGRTPLSTEQIDLIREWVGQGAPRE
jgi:hypothetical protein